MYTAPEASSTESSLRSLRDELLMSDSSSRQAEIAVEIKSLIRSSRLPAHLSHLAEMGLRSIIKVLCEDTDLLRALPASSNTPGKLISEPSPVIVLSRLGEDGSRELITDRQLKAARDVLGIKLSEVRDQLSVSKTTVWKWEKGESDVSAARKMVDYVDELELRGVSFGRDGGISWAPQSSFADMRAS